MIYFAQFDSGAIKIGVTEHLKTRLASLASGRRTKVKLLATLEGGREEEKAIHERFAHLRFGQTEQFKPTKELMEFIGKPLLVSANPEAVEVQPFVRVGMFRVNYHLAERQIEALKELSEREGLSVAELIRRAIDAWLERTSNTTPSPER